MKINRVMLVFMLLLSIIFSGCRSSEPKGGENAPNSVITGELPDPASAAIAETQSFDEENSKQCLCIYKRPKSPISAEAEVGDSFAC